MDKLYRIRFKRFKIWFEPITTSPNSNFEPVNRSRDNRESNPAKRIIFGILFILVTSYPAYVVFPRHFVKTISLFFGTKNHTTGEVLNVITIGSTKTTINGEISEITFNQKIQFSYSIYSQTKQNNIKYIGISYSDGPEFRRGQRIDVEYLKNNPSVSRISNCSNDISTLFGVMSILFIAFGAAMTFDGIRKYLDQH